MAAKNFQEYKEKRKLKITEILLLTMSKTHPSEENEEQILESSDNLSKGRFLICENPHTFPVFTAYLPMQFPFRNRHDVTNYM
jgi:hypothetical protein